MNELIELIIRKSQQLNQRFYRLEKADIGGTGESAYYFAMKETGKDKPRYTVSARKLRNLTYDEQLKYLENIQRKLDSSTSTIRGVKALQQKRVKRAIEELRKEDIYIDDEDSFAEFLKKYGRELLPSNRKGRHLLDSLQIIEDYQKYRELGLSIVDIGEAFLEYQDKGDYSSIISNLDRLVKEKEEKED